VSSRRPGSENTAGVVRLCGILAAGLGLLALSGWILGLPTLASFGSARIPMAPVTALLFVLYGTAAILRARPPLAGAARRFGVAVNSAGAAIAALLFLLSIAGIRPTVELLGFTAPGAPGGVASGHMSPVTAICFLLASVSFLGSLPPSDGRAGRAAAARWSAGLLLVTGYGLFLAYLFGSPLFYGGSFIPPAAPTSVAFVLLGSALLALARRETGSARREAGPEARLPWALVLVFVLLAAAIVVAGGLHLRSEGRRYRGEVEHQLSAVAQLQTSELAQWLEERQGDASVILGNTSFSALVRRLTGEPPDARARAQLGNWLTKVQTHYEFDRISVLDARGADLLAVPAGRSAVSSLIVRRVPEILRSARVTFEDFYRDEHDGRVYLSFLVPIHDEVVGGLGIVDLRIDPETYVYPYLALWPTPARSAETLLVRRDGDDALFLSAPRYLHRAALSLRVPLASSDVVAVKAALGEEGIVEGRDYRGVPVIAALRAVPGSPWSLIARMDATEVNAPLRRRFWEMVVLVAGMLGAAAAGVGLIWRERRIRDFREHYAAEQERAWLHDVIARSFNEVYVFDPATLRFRFVNRGACRNLGYTEEELAGLTPLDLKPEFTAESFGALLEPLRAADRPQLAFETVHRRKDGSRYPVEVHLQLVDSAGTSVFLAVINDITERRRAETRIRQLNRVYAMLSDVNQAIVRIREPLALFAEACRIAVETGGFRLAWIGLRDAQANGVRPVAHAGVADGYLEKLRIELGADGGPRAAGPTASALREGVHAVCNDIEHDPRMAPWRDDALALGYRASAAFPLTVRGETLGAFNLYAGEPDFFDAGELRLLDELATDLSFAMEVDQLEETRLRLATAIEQSPVAVTVTNGDGRIEYVNPAFTQITGYTPQEALGGNPRMLKSGRQEPALYQDLWATIRAGRSWRGELVNRRKDGTFYTQELTIAPVRDAAQNVTHFIAFSQDVSRRKQVERELQGAEARYRGLFEQSPDGVLLIDAATGAVIEANEAAHAQLGYSREEFAGLRISDYEASESPASTRAHMRKVLAVGSDDFETLHRTKQGEIRNVHVWTRRVELGERAAFHCIFEDITERKRAEASLRASEERYRTLFDRNLAGVYRSSLDGRLLECNESFARIFGFASRQDALGESATALYPRPADRAAFVEKLQASGLLVNHESEGRRRDGSPVWMLENAHLVEGGEASGGKVIEGTVLDVTDRKTMEGELRQAQKIEAIGQLAGGVAHDFNNILGVILGYGELAQAELAPESPVRALVTEMVGAAQRAAALTRQLQAFSRKQVLQPRPLDLNALVSEMHKMLDRVIGADVELIVRPAPDLGTVRADPGQIEQILLNLAVNARDAMPEGGTLTIETANFVFEPEYAEVRPPAAPGRYVMLAVSDDGVGMDAETRARIFDPFFTTKPAGQGTGLGLATVHGIVKQSEGYIWVYSEPGRGTTFKVYLPRVDEPAEALAPSGPPKIAPGGRETILLVEDNPALRELVRRRLEASGYTVLLAADGEEALALAEAHARPIDLLLTDVVMPKLGGVELARRLASRQAGLRVIYMSGYSDGAVGRHGVLEKGVLLLEKPFSGERLATVVREALDRTGAG
jgi:PAS domain S-box-containing protein